MSCYGTTICNWVVGVKSFNCLSTSLQNCFNTALNSEVGVTYNVVLVLATQVVSGGIHYLLFGSQTTVTNPPSVTPVIIDMFKSIDGTCSVSAITQLSCIIS